MQHLPHENLVFGGPGDPKMKSKCSNFDDVFEPRDAAKNVTPWLSGRLGGAAPLEIRPLSLFKALEGAVSEAT